MALAGAPSFSVRWLAALVVWALAGCGGEAPPPAPPPPEVGILTLQARPFELTTELPGRTAAFRVAEVRPQVSGILQRRLFDEGSLVQAGQVLYEMDSAPYRAAYQRAAADLVRAQAAAEVARLRAERYGPLARAGAVPRQDNDDVQAALRQMSAEVDAARAGLEAARINLDYTRIRAPITGVISESYITEGALLTAGQTGRLAQVTQLDPIYLDIQRPTVEMLRLRRELDAGRLERSGPETARVALVEEDGAVYPLPGELQFSGVTVDPGTASVSLRAVFPNPDRRLLPGMYARARLREGIEPTALLVPQQAVTRSSDGRATALVVGAENRLELREVVPRRAVGDAWLVGSGLVAGERVVITGPLRLGPGMVVRPVPIAGTDPTPTNGPADAGTPAAGAGHG